SNHCSSGTASTEGQYIMPLYWQMVGTQERLGHLCAAWRQQQSGPPPTSSCSSRSIRLMAASTPHVLLQQYWLHYLLLILVSTRRPVWASAPPCLSCSLVICRNRARSPASHSKGHADRQPMKVW